MQTSTEKSANKSFTGKDHLHYPRVRRQIISGIFLISVYLFWTKPASLSLTNAWLSLSIIWLGFLPGLLYLRDPNRPPMPFLPLLGLFYGIEFGLPQFFEGTQFFRYTGVNLKALTLVNLGLVILYCSLYFSGNIFWKRISPLRLPRSFSLGRLRQLFWVLILTNLVFLLFPFFQNIPSLNQFMLPVGYTAFGLFIILWKRGYLTKFQLGILFFLIIPCILMARLASGSVSHLMKLFLFVAIVIRYDSNRIPFLLLAFVISVYLILNPLKSQYRYLAWNSPKYLNAGVLEQTKLFAQLAMDNYFGNNKLREKRAGHANINRIAHSVLLSGVVEHTPKTVPYWNGTTYKPLFTKLVPRALFPNKPKENLAHVFGHRYGLLHPTDHATAINIPWIVEMYINFGSMGVITGMGILGILLAFLEKKFNQPNMTFLEFVVGASIILPLFYQESNFSLMVGAIPQFTICIYLYFQIGLRHKI